MPSDLEALEVFQNSSVLFGPSKAVNAGGVAVSGLEMAQNASHLPWKCDDVEEQLQEIMAQIHATCLEHGRQLDGTIDYVAGANIGGFKRVLEASRALGW